MPKILLKPQCLVDAVRHSQLVQHPTAPQKFTVQISILRPLEFFTSKEFHLICLGKCLLNLVINIFVRSCLFVFAFLGSEGEYILKIAIFILIDRRNESPYLSPSPVSGDNFSIKASGEVLQGNSLGDPIALLGIH